MQRHEAFGIFIGTTLIVFKGEEGDIQKVIELVKVKSWW